MHLSMNFLFLAIKNHWESLNDSSLTSYTWTGLSLQEGARYSVKVGSVNNAGFLAAFETNGVVIDISPPSVIVFRIIRECHCNTS